MPRRVANYGKQILLDGEHLADAVNERTAEAIALALTYIGMPNYDFPPLVKRKLEEFFK